MLHGHDIETADAGDGAGGPGHRAVARRSSEHFQAIVLLQKAAGGHAGLAVDIDHLLLVLFGQLGALLIPQPARLGEHRLAGCGCYAVSDPAVLVELLQLLPDPRLEVVVTLLNISGFPEAGLGQKLKQAGEAGHDGEDLLHRVLAVDARQLADQV